MFGSIVTSSVGSRRSRADDLFKSALANVPTNAVIQAARGPAARWRDAGFPSWEKNMLLTLAERLFHVGRPQDASELAAAVSLAADELRRGPPPTCLGAALSCT